jgi:hypothetical protein
VFFGSAIEQLLLSPFLLTPIKTPREGYLIQLNIKASLNFGNVSNGLLCDKGPLECFVVVDIAHIQVNRLCKSVTAIRNVDMVQNDKNR